jgi:hypothetical protein
MNYKSKAVVAGVAAGALLIGEIAEHGKAHAVFTVPAAVGGLQANIAMSNVSAQMVSYSPMVGSATIRFFESKG